MEKVVREAAQRFRGTLPKDYLNEQEYALYERLYGPPLRETEPEDVGIPTHADMEAPPARADKERTLLRELEGGTFEKVTYEIPRQATAGDGDQEAAQGAVDKAPGYIEIVARNQREYDALQKLARDFEVAQQERKDREDAAALHEDQEAQGEEKPGNDKPGNDKAADGRAEEVEDDESEESWRFHPYTLQGRFHDSPIEITLPYDELEGPISELLRRADLNHVRLTAEAAYGGKGLPTSPATSRRGDKKDMTGGRLPPSKGHMTEIGADAFLAAYLAPVYTSMLSVLREVRRRAGHDWLQARLKQGKDGGLSVLDAGGGGAGLVAWQQIVNAEWEVLRDKGEVQGQRPPGKKTVVIGSDRLRDRVKTFLDDTTFLPRLPDYEHSGKTRGEHLDAGDHQQRRKRFDVILASHLFVKEEEHVRHAVLKKLWRLLDKDGGVLVVVEKAHPRGFEAVAHVRHTVLKQFVLAQPGKTTVDEQDSEPRLEDEPEAGHIIAPCTNQGVCPMYKTPGKGEGRKDFCRFGQRFVRPRFYSRMLQDKRDVRGQVEFSYVAIRRGVARESGMSGKEATARAFRGYQGSKEQPDMSSLPRVLLPPLKAQRHVTIDVCTAEGLYERWTVPKSFSKLAYHDARKARWGDLWALGAKTRVPRRVRDGAAATRRMRKMEQAVEGTRLRAKEKRIMEMRAKKQAQKGRKGRKGDDVAKELMDAEESEEERFEREMDEEDEDEDEDEEDEDEDEELTRGRRGEKRAGGGKRAGGRKRWRGEGGFVR